MADIKPVAFLSFVNSDFHHEEGRIAQFRERLADEVSMHTGKDLSVFVDRDDALWKQAWEERVEQATDDPALLISFITPRFFRSDQCKSEMEAFIELERQLNRNDLVLPLYYVRCPFLDDDAKQGGDEMVDSIIGREHRFDWRELRFQPISAPEVGKALEELALRIREVLEPPQQSRLVRMAMDRMPGFRRNQRPGDEPIAQPQLRSQQYEYDPDFYEEVEEEEKGPQTRVVDPMGRADHVTISEAILAADSGDRIMVRPGLYQESLVIDKPVEIIGDGATEDIVIQSVGANAILFKTTMGTVSNITLRQMHGGEWFCVNATQGRLFLEECDITSHSLACVAISGGADPRLRRNKIHHSKQSGIIVYDNGLGNIDDNDVYANGLSGVEIRNGGNPTLHGNRIYENKEADVYVYDDGQGKLENNDIYLNSRAGMRIGNSGRPVLRRNRINKNGIVAIWAPLKGGGDVEENDLRGNAYGAWKVSAESEPLLRRSGNLE
ncbi:MAG: hypothetical protein BZY81_08990 [SAR202 cluster bacterium Io17-Chloro-G4]|nr:MAG: hypothetical protein BZY81_08990 [SAR202 cluster bacterium Io17-Chloro-G4]